MGSIDNAFLTGFVCRLCSKVTRNVIHIYGEKGRKMRLLPIINKYLSISVRLKDELPKTICQNCADHIVQQSKFIESVKRKNKLISDYQNKRLSINDLLNNRRVLSPGT